VAVGSGVTAEDVDEASLFHAGGKAGTMPEWVRVESGREAADRQMHFAEVAIGQCGKGCRGCVLRSAFATPSELTMISAPLRRDSLRLSVCSLWTGPAVPA
jgi:hypothetical protein